MQKLIRGVLVLALAGATVSGLQAQQLLTGSDLGIPTQAGATIYNAGTDTYTIEGGGSDIWGNADTGHYAYMNVTGDFDYVMKVESLTGNAGDGGWSKVELMARHPEGYPNDPPATDARHLSNMTTRPSSDTPAGGSAGVNNRGPQFRARYQGSSSWTGPNPAYPPNMPDNWVRMERVGDTFWMYTSNDGVTWNGYNPWVNQGFNTAGMFPPGNDNAATAFFIEAWPETIFLGIAVTAHSAPDITTAVVSSFGPYTGQAPISITTQPPATIDQSANSTLTISVEGTGDPVHYEWRKDGVPVPADAANPSALSPTLTIPLVPESASGTYTCRLFGAGQTEVISDPCVVTISEDTTPPMMTRAIGAPLRTQATITWSEPVTAPTATTPANYSIAGLTVTAAALSPDGSKVTLTTSQQTEDTQYTITVNNVQDLAGLPVAPGSTIVFNSAKFVTGLVQWERWDWTGDINGLIQGYADGTLGPPDVTWATSLYESGRDLADNYGGHGYAWLKPQTSGDYRFIVTADDNARVFLSTDADPANKLVICGESSWSNNREWSSASSEQDTETITETWVEWPTFEVTLTAGETYYLEGFWDEGGGGDGLELTWTTYVGNGGGRPANGTASALSGDLIGSYIDPTLLPPVIRSPSASTPVTINGGESATLSVVADYATSYQWQWNAVDIAGATGADYVIDNAVAIDSGAYRCIVSNENGSATSQPFHVLVTATGVFAIEAEDFDYDGGQHIAEASTMPYLGGAYVGLSATHGVDYNSGNGSGDSPLYRTGAVIAQGTASPMGNEQPGGQFAITRMGEWETTTNYKVGWVDSGDWGNYTRTFPTPAQTYWVLAASSRDILGAGGINQNLGLVTAGVGTANQTVQPLGNFIAPGTGAWSRNSLTAMTDSSGAIATVELGGLNTIRWNYNAGDAEYLVFVPATDVGDIVITSVVREGNSVTITWTGGGEAYVTDDLNGTWTPTGDTDGSFTATIQPGNAFLLIKKN